MTEGALLAPYLAPGGPFLHAGLTPVTSGSAYASLHGFPPSKARGNVLPDVESIRGVEPFSRPLQGRSAVSRLACSRHRFHDHSLARKSLSAAVVRARGRLLLLARPCLPSCSLAGRRRKQTKAKSRQDSFRTWRIAPAAFRPYETPGRMPRREGRLPLSPGRPFLALLWPWEALTRAQSTVCATLTLLGIPGKSGPLSLDKQEPWRRKSVAPRSAGKGQGQREVLQSAVSASLQTSKQLLAYSSSDRKQKPGRLALFGRPRFSALVSVAFHPLV